MKVIVTGATGFVGSEIVRQCLNNPSITSIIALARKPINPPANLEPEGDVSKLQSIVIEDYGIYSPEVKKHFASADGCIWTVAITPSKSTAYEFSVVRRVCLENPLTALEAIRDARSEGTTKPFRFIYMSGVAAERDQTKTPRFKPQYSLMRGEAESKIVAFAEQSEGRIEACAAKPGLITSTGLSLRNLGISVVKYGMSVPTIGVSTIACAMLHQIAHGFEKEPLMNDDLERIGSSVIDGTEKL